MSSTTAEYKRRATAAATRALFGATFMVTEDDYGDLLFVVTQGAATCVFHSRRQFEEWLEELPEVVSC